MTARSGIYSVRLMGAFRLQGSDGRRVEVASKKAIGLIALLATGRDGERTRQFLQDKLWGSRESAQAQTSLRRELSNLRRLFADAAEPLLLAEGTRVGLNLKAIAFDIPIPGAANENDRPEPRGAAEFLEGLDLPGEEGFEDWLREQRALIHAQAEGWETTSDKAAAPPLPAHLVDMSTPAPGFEGRPAVAVLKFQNQTGDSGVDIAAEGISEDLIDQQLQLRAGPGEDGRQADRPQPGCQVSRGRPAANGAVGVCSVGLDHRRHKRKGHLVREVRPAGKPLQREPVHGPGRPDRCPGHPDRPCRTIPGGVPARNKP